VLGFCCSNDRVSECAVKVPPVPTRAASNLVWEMLIQLQALAAAMTEQSTMIL